MSCTTLSNYNEILAKCARLEQKLVDRLSEKDSYFFLIFIYIEINLYL